MPLPILPFLRWQDAPEAEWMRDWRTARRTIVLESDDPAFNCNVVEIIKPHDT